MCSMACVNGPSHFTGRKKAKSLSAAGERASNLLCWIESPLKNIWPTCSCLQSRSFLNVKKFSYKHKMGSIVLKGLSNKQQMQHIAKQILGQRPWLTKILCSKMYQRTFIKTSPSQSSCGYELARYVNMAYCTLSHIGLLCNVTVPPTNGHSLWPKSPPTTLLC